jgi:drug/metabolite transporter superfamily protein YnfA
MLFTLKTRDILFKALAGLACLAGAYHLAGIFYKVNESPVWRHLLFVGISVFCVYGFLKRPKYFAWFIALLFAQQCYSHGTYAVNLWMQRKQIHWISLIDLVLLSIGLICLVEDCKVKNKKPG